MKKTEAIQIKNILKQLNAKGILVEEVDGELKLFSETGMIEEDLLAQISTHKSLIIEQLRRTHGTSTPEIPKAPVMESYPLSNAQSRLWILGQFQGGSEAYNIPDSVLLTLKNLTCFQNAVNAVIDRHEILRTVFRKNAEGEVRQWILDRKALKFEMDHKDFRSDPEPDQAVSDYVNKDISKPFNLEEGPLFRASLLQVAEHEYMFYYNMHHIISDGWSMEVLTKNVLAYYHGIINGVDRVFPPLRIQYKDYAYWLETQHEREDYQINEKYWLSNLRGNLPVLNLPSSKTRPIMRTFNGGRLITLMPANTIQASRDFIEREEGSLFMLLLAVLNVTLFRYTAERHLVVGTPVAGREHLDLEDQIGLFINTLVLKNEVKPGQSFSEFYQELKRGTIASFQHQSYPFDRLIEALNLKHDTSRNAVFDILMALHNIGEVNTEVEELATLEDQVIYQGDCDAKLDLSFTFKELGEQLLLQIEYNSDVYEYEMLKDFVGHYKTLLSTFIESSHLKIDEVNYLSAPQQEELLHTLNDTHVNYEDLTIHELFEKQVLATPDAIALFMEGESLSYKELDQCANSFAHCLIQDHSIKKGDLVAVKLDRDRWLMIAILGILKAGAGYVPIEPGMVASREGHILKDSGVSLVVTASQFLLDYTKAYPGAMLTIDTEFDATKYSAVGITPSLAKPNDLAYVIYTSGSTGTPKGTLIEHGSVANYIVSCSEFCLNDKSSPSSFGLFTSISFDLTVTTLFMPLFNGGALHILPRKLDVSATLNDYIAKGISCIKLTPAHIMLMEDIEATDSALELVVVGGDVLHQRHLEILRGLNPDIRIYNEYGPTETTVGCTLSLIKEQDTITIGSPIGNTQIYILDEQGRLVPKGVVGEICVGGAGLARGYLGLDKLTARKFIPHPFKKGARLYRTGDLGKWLSNGKLHFIGRRDDQVKIRGHRIELGEIEHRIRAHTEIREAALLVSDGIAGDKELVAYFVASQEQVVSDLRRFIGDGLPDYMIPSRYIQLEEMPLTVNGKIDRKALPDIEGRVLSSGSDYVAPQNETEEKLVSIWENIFALEKIGVNDDFFSLGGQSLSAIKLTTRIHKEMGVMIDLKDVFAERTIASLSEYIDTIQKLEKSEVEVEDPSKKLIF